MCSFVFHCLVLISSLFSLLQPTLLNPTAEFTHGQGRVVVVVVVVVVVFVVVLNAFLFNFFVCVCVSCLLHTPPCLSPLFFSSLALSHLSLRSFYVTLRLFL